MQRLQQSASAATTRLENNHELPSQCPGERSAFTGRFPHQRAAAETGSGTRPFTALAQDFQ